MARLSIPDEPTSITFDVVTTTTVFPFAFAVFDKADLTVTVAGVVLDQAAYTLTGTLLDGGGYQGGTVTLNDSVDDCTVRVYRDITPQRAEGFGAVTSVPVRAVDQALNRQMAATQDPRRRINDLVLGAVGAEALEDALASVVAIAAGQLGIFDTKSEVQGASVPTATDVLLINGRNYERREGEPAHTGKVQSGDGSWFEIAEPKLRLSDFDGAGNGATDDTVAVLGLLGALPPGGVWEWGRTASGVMETPLVSQSLIIEKPIRIEGGSKEQCKIIFAAAGDYQDLGDDTIAAVVVLHSTTVLPGLPDPVDGRRSVFSSIMFEAEDGRPDNLRGFVAASPVYCYEVDAFNFGLDGITVMANPEGEESNDNGILVGNANGSSFMNCLGIRNGRHGFEFIGNNANACVLNGCRTFQNGGWGFHDDSLLGNTYIGCEADSNGDGGYWSNPAKPNRSYYLGCYSETPTHFSLNPRNIIVGYQGLFKPSAATAGVSLTGLPDSRAYMTHGMVWADTDDIANTNGDAPNAGKYMSVSSDGWDFRASGTALHVRLRQILNNNYVDFMNGADAPIRFPQSAFVGNINPARPHLGDGFSLGASGFSAIGGAGEFAPTTGTHVAGKIWLNDNPAPGEYGAWICTASGSPGTWKGWGLIEA